MSVFSRKPMLTNVVKHQNEAESSNNSTVYLEYETTSQISNYSSLYESHKEEIREALLRLHDKLEQLKHDRDLAENSLRSATKRQNNEKTASNHYSRQRFEDANNDCDQIEAKLANILQNSRLESAKEPNSDSVSLSKPKSAVKIVKVTSNDRVDVCGKMKTDEMIEPKRRPNDTVLAKDTPFVSSGIHSQTYSLIVNMQTLINVLQLQNPRLAVQTASFAITDQILDILQRNLRDMGAVLRETICLLKIKWKEMMKTMRNTANGGEISLHRLEMKNLKKKNDNLRSHFNEITKLEARVQRLLKRRKGFTDENETKPKLKQGGKVPGRVYDVAKNDLNVELLQCIKRFLFLLKT